MKSRRPSSRSSRATPVAKGRVTASPSPATRSPRRIHMSFEADVPIGATVDAVWDALVNPAKLEQWFCEHADVSLVDRRYDFWGRYTPDNPSRDEGRHRVVDVVHGSLLRYGWRIR